MDEGRKRVLLIAASIRGSKAIRMGWGMVPAAEVAVSNHSGRQKSCRGSMALGPSRIQGASCWEQEMKNLMNVEHRVPSSPQISVTEWANSWVAAHSEVILPVQHARLLTDLTDPT
jgi:hypothetical protein